MQSGFRVFFFDDLLKNLVVQSQVGIHMLELPVFLFKLFKASDLGYVHAAVLGFPLVESHS